MSMQINLQCYIVCSKYPPLARAHALSGARHLSMDASSVAVRCCAKSYARFPPFRCRFAVPVSRCRFRTPLPLPLPLRILFLPFMAVRARNLIT